MAYEVTATRKRPQAFDQMAGQDFIVTTLKASVSSGRIAHAYLFSGPRGVGKTSAARILARSLNCETGPSEIPCGECGNCMEISRGNSLDVIEIDGASNTSVNDVREIKDEVLFAPNAARYKIYIIDEVHMLSNSAFNALLKTIEEPPPYVIFIFATTEVHKVPATIRSRCQQFNFRLISIETIKSLLSEVVAELTVQAEDEALFWIAKEATGSLRDAYTLLDQVVSFSDMNITFELIREKLGLVGLDRMNDIVDRLIDGKANEAIEMAGEILFRGVSIDRFMIDLAEYFRCILFLRHGITKESLLGYTPDRFSKRVYETLSDVQIEKALDLVLRLYRDIRYSLNQRYELDLLLSRLSVLPSYIHPRDLLERITEIRKELLGGAAGKQIRGTNNHEIPPTDPSEEPQSQTEPEQTSSIPKEIDGNLGEENREAIMASIRKKYLSLASSLEKVSAWRLEGDILILTCQSNYDAANIRREQQKMMESVSGALGRPYKIELESGLDSPDAGAEESDSEDENIDNVEMIRRVFRGEIVEE
ncbi:MAG: DNA polymerase III subunit gamma/tau [Spirochaetales bacterium]|nr:DNA polymerase III subunit gamma/tau [Spirochaetales bacterium]